MRESAYEKKIFPYPQHLLGDLFAYDITHYRRAKVERRSSAPLDRARRWVRLEK
jgi:hypothetical protein